MLKEHGTIAAMEVQIAKKHLKSDKKSLLGGWYTKEYLAKNASYTKRLNLIIV